jgi:acetyl-CoA decarbonylase/synthase complex subunit beta
MPSDTKEKLKEFIPESIYGSIATEKDATSIPQLREFLEEHHHPVTARWSVEEAMVNGEPGVSPVFSVGDVPLNVGGFRIILKNARITADKVIIQPVKPGRRTGGE